MFSVIVGFTVDIQWPISTKHCSSCTTVAAISLWNIVPQHSWLSSTIEHVCTQQAAQCTKAPNIHAQLHISAENY